MTAVDLATPQGIKAEHAMYFSLYSVTINKLIPNHSIEFKVLKNRTENSEN